MFIRIAEVLTGKLTGKEVALRGWVYRKREQKDLIFIVLRDGSGIIQAVVKDPKLLPVARKVTIESSIELSGAVKAEKKAPGGYEIAATRLSIVGLAERFPIAKDLSEEFLRDVRHLWLRSQSQRAIMLIRSETLAAIRDWFRAHGYTEISPPMFVSGACEGGATLFELKYFDKRAFLTQSWQLYAEAIIQSIEKIFTIAPSFRAEKSRTIRHLTEFWHVEAEAAWASMQDIMTVQEQLLSYVCQRIAKKCKAELAILHVDPAKLAIKPPFPRITYAKAIELLQKKGFDIKFGDDLGFDEEKAVAEYFGGPFFIYDYPAAVKAFYCKVYADRPEIAMSADLLVPRIGEITTGGARIEDKDKLIARIKELGFRPEDYDWYVDLRRYGTVPHAGFGMGVERLLAWMLDLPSVWDAIPFPRTPARVYP
jgi:asparaginyl-tRNA synthetase